MVSSGVWQVYPPDRDMHLKREGQRDEPLICLIFCGQLGMLQMDHHWGPQKCIQLHSSRSSSLKLHMTTNSSSSNSNKTVSKYHQHFRLVPACSSPPNANARNALWFELSLHLKINIFLSINEMRAENPGRP